MAIFRNAGELIDADTGCHFVCVMAAGAMAGEEWSDLCFEETDASGVGSVLRWRVGSGLGVCRLLQRDCEEDQESGEYRRHLPAWSDCVHGCAESGWLFYGEVWGWAAAGRL